MKIIPSNGNNDHFSLMAGAGVSTVILQHMVEAYGFKAAGLLGSVCVEFACSPYACVGFIRVFRSHLHIKLFQDFSLHSKVLIFVYSHTLCECMYVNDNLVGLNC